MASGEEIVCENHQECMYVIQPQSRSGQLSGQTENQEASKYSDQETDIRCGQTHHVNYDWIVFTRRLTNGDGRESRKESIYTARTNYNKPATIYQQNYRQLLLRTRQLVRSTSSRDFTKTSSVRASNTPNNPKLPC